MARFQPARPRDPSRQWWRNLKVVRPIVVGPGGLVQFSEVDSDPDEGWVLYQPAESLPVQNWVIGSNMLMYPGPTTLLQWTVPDTDLDASSSDSATGTVEVIDDDQVTSLATICTVDGGGDAHRTLYWYEYSPGFSSLNMSSAGGTNSLDVTLTPYVGPIPYIKVSSVSGESADPAEESVTGPIPYAGY
jgi:hypothetical protein